MSETKPTFWLNLFSPRTWQQFLDAGGEVTGFRANRWKQVQQIAVGDYMLCYLTQVSRFVGVLKVVSEPYQDHGKTIWDDNFPCRVKVELQIEVSLETGVPIRELSDRLSFFQGLKNPNAWSGMVRGSPTRWKVSDGQAVIEAMVDAKRSPVVRPIPKAKLKPLPKGIPTDRGVMTVPDDDQTDEQPAGKSEELRPVDAETSAHTEIQWLLLKLGSDLGLDVWVARNDRSRTANGKSFVDLPRMRRQLPRQFDEITTRTIELIDVLWLQGNAIVAAFEVESTTVIYSGLLRMSDLLAMQPNLNIPLYVVAPEERRDKVIVEVNRPTFSRRTPPLNEACRYISFSTLRQRLPELASIVRYLKPDVLEELSEPCVIEQT
jgi:hypothetical protein